MNVKNVLARIAPSIRLVLARIECGMGEAEHLDLPWGGVEGSHGRVFVTRRYWWDTHQYRTTVHLDGVPVWAMGGGYPLPQGWLNWEEERKLLLRQRAERRMQGEQYLALLDEATRLVNSGAPLPHRDGQEGGYFLLPCGGRVSARGLAARLGIPAQPFWTDGWNDFIARVVQGAAPDHPHRIPRKAGWREVEAA